MTDDQQPRPRIYTIGHSTLPIERFLALLTQHQIELLVDIRHYPWSRRNPQFSQWALQNALYAQGISYTHLGDLGGRRSQIVAGSGNEGWRVSAFRAYADYATYSPAFGQALETLMSVARHWPTAYMCSEHTHLKCHRRIVSDYLLALDWDVQHIASNGTLASHVYTEHAEVSEGRVRYPAQHKAEAENLSLWSLARE